MKITRLNKHSIEKALTLAARIDDSTCRDRFDFIRFYVRLVNTILPFKSNELKDDFYWLLCREYDHFDEEYHDYEDGSEDDGFFYLNKQVVKLLESFKNIIMHALFNIQPDFSKDSDNYLKDRFDDYLINKHKFLYNRLFYKPNILMFLVCIDGHKNIAIQTDMPKGLLASHKEKIKELALSDIDTLKQLLVDTGYNVSILQIVEDPI